MRRAFEGWCAGERKSVRGVVCCEEGRVVWRCTVAGGVAGVKVLTEKVAAPSQGCS